MTGFFYFVEHFVKTSPLWSIPLVFVSGILMSLSPCFYPLIPVILGIIGVNDRISKKKALILSLIYVLGISSVYTFLGVLSAVSGKMFGQVSELPLVQFIAGGVMVLMGLALWNLFHFQLSFPVSRQLKELGWLGVFLLGIVSGLAVGSCTLPVLGAILVLIAFQKDVWIGGVLLFSFSLGIGAVFMVVAVLGNRLTKVLNKKSNLSLAVKKVMGIIIILIGIYFIFRGVEAL